MKKKKIVPPSLEHWNKFTKEMKFDWWMQNCMYDDYNPNALLRLNSHSIAEAKSHIARRLDEMIKHSSTKCMCPTCEKSQGFTKNSLTAGILEYGTVLVRESVKIIDAYNLKFNTQHTVKTMEHIMPSVHYDFVKDLIKKETGRNPTNYKRIKHWGFVDDDSEHKNHLVLGKGEYDGMHIPTAKLLKFMENQFQVPKVIYTHNDKLHHEGTDMVYYKDCGIMKYVDRQQYRTTYY